MNLLQMLRTRFKLEHIWYFLFLGIFLMGLFLFGMQSEGNYREVILCGAIAVVFFGALALYLWTDIEFYKFAIIFIICMGAVSLMIQPILNIADETTHFARAEFVSRGNIITNQKDTEYKIIQSVKDLQKNVKINYFSSDVKGENIDYTMTTTGHIAASNASFLYFPQAIGIIVAKILHLDAIWMLWLARAFNLFCYALGVGYAIKIAPKLKFALFFVSVLPMSIHQAASCSADSMTIMLAVLLVGEFLRLYCSEDEIGWKDILRFFALAALGTVAKVTNVFMGGLILLIPKERFKASCRAIWKKILVVFGLILVGGLYYIYIQGFPSGQEHLAYLEGSNVNAKGQILYIFTHFMEWARNFGATLVNYSESYVQSMSTYGWLEYRPPLVSLIITFMFGKICIQEQGPELKKFQRVLLFLMVMGIYAATCLAMYISWTPVGSATISGVQGRYFIPMLVLSILLFSSSKTTTQKNQYNADVVTMLCLNGIMLMSTALKYY